MKRTLFLLFLLTALTLYGLVIYSWWVEGDCNIYKQELEAKSELYRF